VHGNPSDSVASAASAGTFQTASEKSSALLIDLSTTTLCNNPSNCARALRDMTSCARYHRHGGC